MKKRINSLFLVFLISLQSSFSQEHSFARDTTIVAKLIGSDSVFNIANTDRTGFQYYYGLYHLKVGVIDLNSNKIIDTLIIAYVYNMMTEKMLYRRKFDLTVGKDYIFIIGGFTPTRSDFPKLQGRINKGGEFYPVSDRLIRHYKQIYRVIYVVEKDDK